MNRNGLKEIKLYVGPMTKNVVDAVIEFANKFNIKIGFIPSRRQIEFDQSGYVNNWTTRTFMQYIRSKTNLIGLERDHGGPNQGLTNDDGFASLFQDTQNFDIVHIDVWKKYPNFDDGVKKTIEYIKYCHNVNHLTLFEVGTEQSIRPFNLFELDNFLFELQHNLTNEEFSKILYCVIQSGTSLKGTINTGKYDSVKLKDMCYIVNKYNILSKEHNSDFVDINEIYDRYNNGLNAINIAPEFGQIETNCILELINNNAYLLNIFYTICLNSNRWVKWVASNFKPEDNKIELIKICGHYVLSDPKMKEIISKFPELSDLVKQGVFEKLYSILTPRIS